MLCPVSHPGRVARLDGVFNLNAFRLVASLSSAVARFDPDLLIPGDERARRAMHVLFANGTRRERALIERSLGHPSSFAVLLSRQASMAEVQAAGLPVPDLLKADSTRVLKAHFTSGGETIVLKVDGTWSGQGVRIVQRANDIAKVRRALRWRPVASGFKRLFTNGDALRLMDCLIGPARTLSAQSFIPGGRAGDLAAFCRDGEVLSMVAAEREAGYGEFGPSTIVRVTRHPVLEDGARRFVRRLGLSGFIGFDFVVDSVTEQPRVVEVNPRATGLAAIRPSYGVSPAAAAAASFGAVAVAEEPERDLVAYYPKAWLHEPDDPRLALCNVDIPADEPALVARMGTCQQAERQSFFSEEKKRKTFGYLRSASAARLAATDVVRLEADSGNNRVEANLPFG